MKALVAEKLGDPDVLKLAEIDTPSISADEMLLEVHAGAMNPVDTKARKHGLGGMRVPPFVLGFDVSGVVKELGENARSRFKAGDEVFAFISVFKNGGNAEYAAVDYRTAAKKPAKLSHLEAAALPIAFLTAWEGINERLKVQAGETVLIQGGGGGVGHIAVQLARLNGARVITTASSEASIQLMQDLGADLIINYKSENFTEKISEFTGGKGVPAILDCVGGRVFYDSLDCLEAGGRIATIVEGGDSDPGAKLFFKNASVHYIFVGAALLYDRNPQVQGKILEEAAQLLIDGKLRVHINRTFSLSEMAEAHKLQESGKVTGKLGIKIR